MKDKLRYAERYSQSLRAATGESKAYACPLCLCRFPLSRAEELTWDHYPPQSIGGRDRDIALVCEPCRARWSAIDAEVDRLHEAEALGKRYRDAAPAVISLPKTPGLSGMRHRAVIRARSGTIEIIGRDDANPPEALGRLAGFLEGLAADSGTGPVELKVQADRRFAYDPYRVERALLKAAYLAAFNLLGYPYILSSTMARIRRQMAHPERALVQECAIKLPPGKLVFPEWITLEERLVLPVYVHQPPAAAGLAVFFLRYDIGYWTIVFMPVPARPAYPRYGEIGAALREADSVGIVVLTPSDNLILDRDVVLVDQGGQSWLLYQKGQLKHRRREANRARTGKPRRPRP